MRRRGKLLPLYGISQLVQEQRIPLYLSKSFSVSLLSLKVFFKQNFLVKMIVATFIAIPNGVLF